MSSTFTSIPSGTYASITVDGVCNFVPDAVITVVGSINLAPGAVLDAQSAPSTITVGHNVTAGKGSILGMGCQPSHTMGCSRECHASSSRPATNADTVLLRKLTVGGNVTLTGGGGEIPWSIKGNTIGRNAKLTNITALDQGDPGRAALT